MKNKRQSTITLVVGKNGTGKSTLVYNMIKGMKQRALVVTLNGAPEIWQKYPIIDPRNKKEMASFKGIRQVWYARLEAETLQHIFDNFRDGGLVFDDCRAYLDANINNDIYFRRLLIDFRHKMLDLFFVAHAPPDIPRGVWRFNYTIWIGATDAAFDKNQLKTFSADRVIEIQRQVNQAYKKAEMKGDESHYGIFKWVKP